MVNLRGDIASEIVDDTLSDNELRSARQSWNNGLDFQPPLVSAFIFVCIKKLVKGPHVHCVHLTL